MHFYLTPSSISDLTLFIFASFAAGYLWRLALGLTMLLEGGMVMLTKTSTKPFN